jgi:hypothetical protein
MRLRRLLPVFVIGSGLLVSGCDPQTDILKIFTRQGLTLLEPTRDYIKIGGIVLLPKGSDRLQYEDPYDSLTPASGTSTNFRSVIQNQTDTSTTAVQATVALAQLVSLPIGFSFQDGPQTIKLEQIDSSGTRYTSPMISTLLKKSDTAGEINSRLSEGDRVFIIQEVYNSKSLSVSATSNMSLAANVGGSPVTKSCASGEQGGTQSGGTQSGGTQSGGTQSGGTHSGGTQSGGTQSGGTQSGGTQSGGSQKGVSVNVCRNTQASLSFTSDEAIPFAVRLNEVQVGPGGILQAKEKNFHLPNKALGSDKDLAATVLIDPDHPTATLEFLAHRPR